jgi:hypothetical protein
LRRDFCAERHQLNVFTQQGKSIATAALLAARAIIDVAQPLQMQFDVTEQGIAP